MTERAEEDWANAWKAYYQPLLAGKRILIRPPWIDYQAKNDEIVVILDPGMAFGSGRIPSSRLSVLGLEATVTPGCTVLDVGTGSGILAIAAARLGAATSTRWTSSRCRSATPAKTRSGTASAR